jgi:predicted protein tyrosine phosphatase
VLCVCSAGLLRSPTTALVLSQEPYNYNTRACGSNSGFALILLDDVLCEWADEIVFVNRENYEEALLRRVDMHGKTLRVLNVPDDYEYRAPELMKIIAEQYENTTTFVHEEEAEGE